LVDGWFPTGDIASVDRHGGLHISDRSKDLIKSGGEWISSIAVEDAATSFKGVAMAACVAAAHPKWGERPVLIVQLAPGSEPDEQGLLDFLSWRITKFEMPNRVVFLDALPLTGTGKVLKHELRARFWDCLSS
jgi:acyl-CoA synthetase (AMP-forming)/AMP-acid ligase II